ncbi:MAG: DUF4258 domain-containing protein [Rhizomicrobium sp.]
MLNDIKALVARGDVVVSLHGFRELAADGIKFDEIVASVRLAIEIEAYPDYGKGPCVLVLQTDLNGDAVHVLWGIAKGTSRPAVLVTAYRPETERWSADFMRRKKP